MNSDYADLAKQDINILSVTNRTIYDACYRTNHYELVVLYEYKYTRGGNTPKWGKAMTSTTRLYELPEQILQEVARYREKLEQGE